MVNDYPYGFRLRTSIRYWVETTKRGQRFVSQTLNPKTNQWNKPKKSTYCNVILIGLNEKEHITYTHLDMYSLDEAKDFENTYDEFFDDYQKKETLNIIKILEVHSKVEYKTRIAKFKHKITGEIRDTVPLMDMSNYVEVDDDGEVFDKEQHDYEQKVLNRNINKIAVLNASQHTGINSAMDTFKRC